MKHIALPLLLWLCFGSGPLLAQSCNNRITTSTPTERYHDNKDGSVTDTLTGLQWARCSFGQTLVNDTCRGEPHRLPWAIVSLVMETGWRLPEIAELNSLVELRCIRPAINQQIFPDTAPAAYWSATRFINKDGNYWQVNFLHGESGSEPADATAHVRFVRDEP
jgi:hypothetical protein